MISIRSFLSHRGLLVWLLAGPAMLCAAAPASAQSVDAHRVAAAFVARFPHFVEWPESAMEGRETFEICVAEPDPFGSALDELVEGEEVGERPFSVRRVDHPDLVDGCHVLFLPSPVSRALPLLRAAADRPVLTIGESGDFLARGGIINFVIIERRMRFEVNAEAASHAGLRVSSQLLDLAVHVRGPG